MGAKGRQNHTPKQRAEAALGVAERLHAAAKKRYDAAKSAAEQAEADLTAAAARLAHKRQDPDLNEAPTLPLGGH